MLEIASLLGADRVRRPSAAEASACETIVEPESTDEIAAIVRKCEADRIALAPIGAGRTLANLRSIPVALGVSLAKMARVVAYEPDDMTVAARSGITLGALNQHLDSRRQRLPIDPPSPSSTTLGAIIGAAKAGPLRLSEGLVRDLLIGVEFVGRDGRIVRAGGRVVKNVAGYDLMKILTGSFGTLGIVTEAVFKVRPIPDFYALAVASFGIEGAFSAAAALHDGLPLSHLEVLSPEPAAAFCQGGKCLLLAGLSGIRSEVDYQRKRVSEILRGTVDYRDDDRAKQAYQRLRDFEFATTAVTAQLAVPPAELARCLLECGAEFRAHAGCGVAQLSAIPTSRQDAEGIVTRWRRAARGARGHLSVLSAPRDMRGELRRFDEPSPGALALMRRLKQTFDPAGIFNPRCFVGGI